MNAPIPLHTPPLRERLSSITRDLPQARHLPGEIYTSPEIAAMEKERIFMKSWLAVARVEELAHPGDYRAMRIAGEPIVVANDKAEGIVAWENRCLHRGVEIAFDEGNTKAFSCLYHAWSYDPAGNLTAAPHMKDSGHDVVGTRMRRLRSAIWRGWVFVSFDADGESFEDFIAQWDKALWYYRTGECRVAAKLDLEIRCNWKFIAENLLDFYHAGTVHLGTFGRFYKFQPGRDVRVPAQLLANGGVNSEFDASNRANDPNLPFPKLSWLGDRQVFSAKGAIFPNINFWSGSDSLRMWHLWPLDVDRTRAICYIMLPEESFKVPDFDAKIAQYRKYVEQVAVEDRAALESLQRGVASPRYVPGPLAHLEVLVHHLLNHYVKVMTA